MPSSINFARNVVDEGSLEIRFSGLAFTEYEAKLAGSIDGVVVTSDNVKSSNILLHML